MKIILFALTIIAIALVAAADEDVESPKETVPPSESSTTSESGTRKYSGNFSFDLFGSSAVQQTIEGLAHAFEEVLKLVGVNRTTSQNQSNTGRFQGNFEFSGEGNKNEKKNSGAA